MLHFYTSHQKAKSFSYVFRGYGNSALGASELNIRKMGYGNSALGAHELKLRKNDTTKISVDFGVLIVKLDYL